MLPLVDDLQRAFCYHRRVVFLNLLGVLALNVDVSIAPHGVGLVDLNDGVQIAFCVQIELLMPQFVIEAEDIGIVAGALE